MFGFKKKNPVPQGIVAPVIRQIKDLAEVSDPVFAQGTLGPGFAVDTANNTIVAPISGEVIVMFPTGHACALRGENGVEVLVHIGIDTVKLKGEGFQALVAQGQLVQLRDWKETAARVPSMDTVVVVTNADKFNVGAVDKNAAFGQIVMELK
ncbi:PTS sugar transporter subunit IIA [Corynebacterium silvaticum]|uniref:Glucose PTS transporter subunit IIA n=1 Tax=Corynebacterium silvaticum TaxID=2320431 RepID=A0A7Y4LL13_9CORY|nr:glucose PTS transporter subunit IIA [Corynebacterium silvaticum]ARU45174.1 glucose PTS transporter subunit IIA [Corynebacterium silvaticum]MBH5301006.1 PTS glucose transporter subunit IIA [Corynebacterium silvaticum]NOM65207.1 PTS glucose transporter subunit IIA [Corynebacterium silvaticum]NON70842.1 PTS glucose transporter subunit IIA [Corynebacterium silvaticum]TFA92780.1 PTS glucose transporter subunit IIA [Corynebacterium silvaticum]